MSNNFSCNKDPHNRSSRQVHALSFSLEGVRIFDCSNNTVFKITRTTESESMSHTTILSQTFPALPPPRPGYTQTSTKTEISLLQKPPRLRRYPSRPHSRSRKASTKRPISRISKIQELSINATTVAITSSKLSVMFGPPIPHFAYFRDIAITTTVLAFARLHPRLVALSLSTVKNGRVDIDNDGSSGIGF